MCGIAGLFSGMSGDDRFHRARSMIQALHHRGPDFSDVWCDGDSSMTLAHARLSIVDLSTGGRQPMVSPSGRYVITYNGEIYNFLELRTQLMAAGMRIKGDSDTSVIVAAFDHWGVTESVQRFVGMFAFGVWDREMRCLHIVRDRVGEKPLYYGWVGNGFAFGSELKALQSLDGWAREIDRDSLALYMRHNYIPAPYTIYKQVYKLLPGCHLTLNEESMTRMPEFSPWDGEDRLCPVRYWSIAEVATHARSLAGQSEAEWIEGLDSLLRSTIRDKMISDVPLGAFLSGGIDSSTVVALMQAESADPVKTFTIGFAEDGYDEAKYASEIARHLGTDHTELYVSARDALDLIPSLPSMYDEPFSDSSQLPTALVASLTRNHVTVALSGDGGDELFCGYNRYFFANRLWGKVERFPYWSRHMLRTMIHSMSPQRWSGIHGLLKPVLPSRLRVGQFGDKLYKFSDVALHESPREIYKWLISHYKYPQDLVIDSSEPMTVVDRNNHFEAIGDFTERMMLMDTLTYLPDDILVKVDRASMHYSLETRIPFLDHRVIEYAWRLPLDAKIRDGGGKWILRKVLERYVPNELTDRPKMGFGVPIDSWLRGPLKDWAESLLDRDRLRSEGYFDSDDISAKWKEHISGDRNWQYHLWDVLMFQSWLETWN